ncbi:Reverse transcriptase zinc-binding domain [Macleaya cordata]|uniref:Reverse transcriptase zinc-binding domain n=1 Tax=Macleaya cordata TaxID=56857 RepID=A0A200Q107_MACCD|nr:Reverse transcriptase zinc-binding domain [Macleaya cordata]
MAAFLIPKNLYRKIDAHLRKYWWEKTLDPNDRKIHLIDWDNLCKPKSEDGLNAWRLVEELDYLLSRALRIVQIPLSSVQSRDRRAWELTRDGNFTAKSAYFGLRNHGSNGEEKMSENFWKMKLPHRVQLLVWKGAKNAIPVKDILNKRINIEDAKCPRCNLLDKSITHALVTCPCVNRIWTASHLHKNISSFVDKSLTDWIKFWLGIDPYSSNRNPKDQFLFVACLMWVIWISRNDLIHNHCLKSDQAIIHKAFHMLPKCQSLTNRLPLRSYAQKICFSGWTPPMIGWWKINTDGGWDPNSNNNGLGFVVRDYLGVFRSAAAVFSNYFCAEEAKIRAIWIAMKKAIE